VKAYPDVTPSLVGLAVNYTLLVPIYLNWVVKFLADMEMYMGAVERVQHYALTPTEDYRLQGTSGHCCSLETPQCILFSFSPTICIILGYLYSFYNYDMFRPLFLAIIR
jgi:hypothetical protein